MWLRSGPQCMCRTTRVKQFQSQRRARIASAGGAGAGWWLVGGGWCTNLGCLRALPQKLCSKCPACERAAHLLKYSPLKSVDSCAVSIVPVPKTKHRKERKYPIMQLSNLLLVVALTLPTVFARTPRNCGLACHSVKKCMVSFWILSFQHIPLFSMQNIFGSCEAKHICLNSE